MVVIGMVDMGRALVTHPRTVNAFVAVQQARLVRGDAQPKSGVRLIYQGHALARSGVQRR